MNATSKVFAVVPVRSLTGSKSRLGEPLDAEERASLVLGLLRRTVRAALEARRLAGVLVVSGDHDILEEAGRMGARTLLQRTDGLNEGLAEARAWLNDRADALLVLPADLPDIEASSIDRLVQVAQDAEGGEVVGERSGEKSGRRAATVVALVPDRHGTGTNALLVSPPDAIEFHFGDGSRQAHCAEAQAAGARYVELDGPLTFDLDTPEDLLLADLHGLDHESGR